MVGDSQVSFSAVAGTTYRIAVAGPKVIVAQPGVTMEGSFVLRIQQF